MATPMKKVWNISDDPNSNVREQVLVIFGMTVMPGRSIKVPADRLENAHKLNKDVEAMLAYVGEQPPASYLAAKSPKHAEIPASHRRSHVDLDATPAVEDAVQARMALKELAPAVEEAAVADVVVSVSPSAEGQLAAESSEVALEETSGEGGSSKKNRWK